MPHNESNFVENIDRSVEVDREIKNKKNKHVHF